MTNFHDNKDWNIYIKIILWRKFMVFMTNFHDNKDWNVSIRFAP